MTMNNNEEKKLSSFHRVTIDGERGILSTTTIAGDLSLENGISIHSSGMEEFEELLPLLLQVENSNDGGD
jgi:hypothetical protein